MSVLTDLIYGGSNAVAGLTEGAVNAAIEKFASNLRIAFRNWKKNSTAVKLTASTSATGSARYTALVLSVSSCGMM